MHSNRPFGLMAGNEYKFDNEIATFWFHSEERSKFLGVDYGVQVLVVLI